MASDVRLFVTPGAIPAPQTSDNNPAGIPLRGTRDGGIISQDWVESMVAAGYGFTANFGVGATPINGTVAFTIGIPFGNIDCPVGTAIIPFFANCFLQTMVGTLNNVIFAYSNALMGNGTSVAAAAGPVSMKTDRRVNSNCVARQAYTAGGAVLAANQAELISGGYAFADATGAPEKRWEWIGAHRGYPVIIGPGSFQIYAVATGTLPTGKGQVSWIEVPANWVS